MATTTVPPFSLSLLTAPAVTRVFAPAFFLSLPPPLAPLAGNLSAPSFGRVCVKSGREVLLIFHSRALERQFDLQSANIKVAERATPGR